MREGRLAASVAVGLDVMAELMAAEVTDLAGPTGKHNSARVAKRHGGEDGTVTLGGWRVPVRRPRVRTVGDDEHELTLESYKTFVSADLLAEVILELIAATRTRSGLRVQAELDQGRYLLGVRVADRELAAVPLQRHDGTGSGTTPCSPTPHNRTGNQPCRLGSRMSCYVLASDGVGPTTWCS